MKRYIVAFACLFFAAMCIVSCDSEQSLDYKRYYSEGNMTYQNHCQSCHGAKGEGLAALVPPLTDSVVLKTLPCVVKFGLHGKITVSGKQFDDKMLPADLSPIQITQVAIYVTNAFGNKNGFKTDDEVQAALQHCQAAN